MTVMLFKKLTYGRTNTNIHDTGFKQIITERNDVYSIRQVE